jgi:hypothetical protein
LGTSTGRDVISNIYCRWRLCGAARECHQNEGGND